MTTLRFAYFRPQEGRITLYVSEDGFDRTQPVALEALSATQQAEIAAALAWLGGALPVGFAALDEVILSLGASMAIAWDGDGVATESSRTLNASVTGSGPKGTRTVSLQGGDAPAEIRAALLAIWDALEAGQNSQP